MTERLDNAAVANIQRQDRPIHPVVVAVVFLMVAIVARWRMLGNPLIHIDEEYYLLVGGRLLRGAIPYVDIWDRKPIGLFLLYAVFRAFGGSGVVAYQLGALASVWITSLLIFAMARRIAPPAGALVAGILYIAYLNLAGGEGGQAPVFYNPLVACAVALVFFRRHQSASSDGDLRLTGAAAMILFGVALQIKYSVVFEGIFAGIMLLSAAWNRGRAPRALAIDALIWISCALIPTALAAAVYGDMGHLGEWWFANVTSIMHRGSEQPDSVRIRIAIMAALLVPLTFGIVLRRWTGCQPIDSQARDDLRFLDGWAASALLGVILFGTWFNHYALPLFVPFALVNAPLWARQGGRIWLSLLVVVSAIWGQRLLYRHEITRGNASTLTAAVGALHGSKGCIFVYDGMPALYDAANSCMLTTRPFPAHLQALNEIGATGIGEAQEVRRIMATRPSRVMTMEPAYDEENLTARAALYQVLATDYRVLYRYTSGGHDFVVYGLSDTYIGLRPKYQKADERFW